MRWNEGGKRETVLEEVAREKNLQETEQRGKGKELRKKMNKEVKKEREGQ